MRRRRQVLQVSTFPFLAVLLCAMGSLILLLLVIDRRAKAVARAKALHTAEQAQKKDARAEAARKAEWERRRQALHALLAREDEDLVKRIKAADSQARKQATDAQDEQDQYRALEKQLRAERTRMSRGRAALESRQAALGQKAKQTQTARNDLIRLTEQVDLLEQTLKELERLRKRDQHTYSLVPYRGRRGDSRRPIYIECAASSLIFHPEKRELHGPRITLADVRSEVESQIARHRPSAQPPGKAEEVPYLLMLIRPDGITSYYRILAAVEGLKFDFGYEFVERDWVLDFSEKEDPRPQPWMTADSGIPHSPGAGTQKSRPGKAPLRIGRPQGHLLGLRTRTLTGGPSDPMAGGPAAATLAATAGQSTGGPLPGSGPPNMGKGSGRAVAQGTTGSGPRGFIFGTGPSEDGKGGMGFAPLPGGLVPPRGASAQVAGAGGPATVLMPPGQGSGNPGAHSPQSPTGTGVGAEGRLSPLTPPGSGPGGGGPLAPLSPLGRGVGGEGAGAGQQSGTAPPSTTGSPGPPTGGTAPSAQSNASAPAGLAFGKTTGGDSARSIAAGTTEAMPGSPQGTQQTTKAPPGNAPAPNSDKAAAQKAGIPGRRLLPGEVGGPPASGEATSTSIASTGQARPTGPASTGESVGKPSSATGSVQDGSGEGQGGSAATGFTTPMLAGGRKGPPRYTHPAPFRSAFGNRDWIIPVECTSSAIILRTARLRFTPSELTRDRAGDNALAQAVRQLIVRRQALVRPGEPPYRPLIQFQVQPDGVRTYYQVYPFLEGVGVPMSRKDLEPEENKEQGKRKP